MTNNKTIKVDETTYEKLITVQELKQYRSLNQAVNYMLGEGVSTNEEFVQEPPAFILTDDESVSWNELRESEVGQEWGTNILEATVIYKDEEGVLVRFNENGGIWLEYFHFF